MKKIILIFLTAMLAFGVQAKAKKHKHHKKQKKETKIHSTAYFFCSKKLKDRKNNLVESSFRKEQQIILAIEAENEENCKMIAETKALQLPKEGWSCHGLNVESFYSCETPKAKSFTAYNGEKLPYLKYKNLSQHIGIIAYLDEQGYDTCLEDRDQMILAGVREVTCHKK